MLTRRNFLVTVGSTLSLVPIAKQTLSESIAQSIVEPRDAKRAIAKLLPLHAKKKSPQAGDWLDRFPNEKGQSFSQYLKGRTRVASVFPRLYLQTIGDFDVADEEFISDMGDAMTKFFGLPTSQLDPISLDGFKPSDYRMREGSPRQLLTTHVLEKLKESRPKDAAAVLGLTAEDLYPGEGWNFVFGLASLDQRVGVWSTARLWDTSKGVSERNLFGRRLLRLAWHETGHMFGIAHCIAYECGMNGCNSLEESDRQPLEYCPECQAKLWWTNNYDPLKRAESLLGFAKAQNWENETRYWSQAVEKLSS